MWTFLLLILSVVFFSLIPLTYLVVRDIAVDIKEIFLEKD